MSFWQRYKKEETYLGHQWRGVSSRNVNLMTPLELKVDYRAEGNAQHRSAEERKPLLNIQNSKINTQWYFVKCFYSSKSKRNYAISVNRKRAFFFAAKSTTAAVESENWGMFGSPACKPLISLRVGIQTNIQNRHVSWCSYFLESIRDHLRLFFLILDVCNHSSSVFPTIFHSGILGIIISQ